MGHPGCRPLPLALRPPRQFGALRLVECIGLVGVRPLGLALGPVPGPTTAVHAAAVGVFVQFEHVSDRVAEEGAVVGHDHHAATPSGHHLLQPGQAVEVEVVRRLIQQRDVEACEEDSCQGHPRRLAA